VYPFLLFGQNATDFGALIASDSLPDATRLTRMHTNARALFLDMRDQERVAGLIGDADIVIR
jgi:hypothetical protein